MFCVCVFMVLMVCFNVLAGEGGTTVLTANDWPLIEPSEVQVAETSVHTAESILTSLGSTQCFSFKRMSTNFFYYMFAEKIKRKDEEVKKALADKEVLVADLLSIPRENYRDIADMVGEKKTDVEPCELVLASLNQGKNSQQKNIKLYAN